MALDPQAQTVLDLVRDSGAPSYETLPVAVARQFYRAGRDRLTPETPEVAETRALTAVGRNGEIPLRLYRPLGAATGAFLPALIYYHGGGWVIGDLDTHDVVCRQLANRAGCVVVAVDYRLAPEHAFPAAVEDAFDALCWVRDQAAALGVDSQRLAVGGDSAGGNLATVIALLARDGGSFRLRHQLLIYPATDFIGHYESQERLAVGYLLTGTIQAWFQKQYLPDGTDRADWRASPLLAPSHAGLPPAYILTAGYDPLCDEGEAYAKKLEAAGVVVTRRHFPGQIHGFITMGRVIGATGVALAEAGDALRAAFMP